MLRPGIGVSTNRGVLTERVLHEWAFPQVKIGIFGIGQTSRSLGYAVAQALLDFDFVSELYIASRSYENVEKAVRILNQKPGTFPARIGLPQTRVIAASCLDKIVDEDVDFLFTTIEATPNATQLILDQIEEQHKHPSQKPSQDVRHLLLENNLVAYDSYCADPLSRYKGTLIVGTNPPDELSYYIASLSGLPVSRVLGLNHTDTFRFVDAVKKKSFEGGVSRDDVEGYTLGPHSTRVIPVFSSLSHGRSHLIPDSNGVPIPSNDYVYEKRDEIIDETRQFGITLLKDPFYRTSSLQMGLVAKEVLMGLIGNDRIITMSSYSEPGDFRVNDKEARAILDSCGPVYIGRPVTCPVPSLVRDSTGRIPIDVPNEIAFEFAKAYKTVYDNIQSIGGIPDIRQGQLTYEPRVYASAPIYTHQTVMPGISREDLVQVIREVLAESRYEFERPFAQTEALPAADSTSDEPALELTAAESVGTHYVPADISEGEMGVGDRAIHSMIELSSNGQWAEAASVYHDYVSGLDDPAHISQLVMAVTYNVFLEPKPPHSKEQLPLLDELVGSIQRVEELSPEGFVVDGMEDQDTTRQLPGLVYARRGISREQAYLESKPSPYLYIPSLDEDDRKKAFLGITEDYHRAAHYINGFGVLKRVFQLQIETGDYHGYVSTAHEIIDHPDYTEDDGRLILESYLQKQCIPSWDEFLYSDDSKHEIEELLQHLMAKVKEDENPNSDFGYLIKIIFASQCGTTSDSSSYKLPPPEPIDRLDSIDFTSLFTSFHSREPSLDPSRPFSLFVSGAGIHPNSYRAIIHYSPGGFFRHKLVETFVLTKIDPRRQELSELSNFSFHEGCLYVTGDNSFHRVPLSSPEDILTYDVRKMPYISSVSLSSFVFSEDSILVGTGGRILCFQNDGEGSEVLFDQKSPDEYSHYSRMTQSSPSSIAFNTGFIIHEVGSGGLRREYHCPGLPKFASYYDPNTQPNFGANTLFSLSHFNGDYLCAFTPETGARPAYWIKLDHKYDDIAVIGGSSPRILLASTKDVLELDENLEVICSRKCFPDEDTDSHFIASLSVNDRFIAWACDRAIKVWEHGKTAPYVSNMDIYPDGSGRIEKIQII